MNRNTINLFEEEATIETNRSHWSEEWTHKTSLNNGDLIPIAATSDILPGTTIKNRTSVLIRMSTPKYPTMDTLEADTYWFWVPWWHIWKNSKAFFGENEKGAWTITAEYSIPKIQISNTAVDTHSIITYMGIPQGLKNFTVNALNVRAYCRIYNYWFRDQNLIAPLNYSDGDETVTYTTNSAIVGGKVCKVAKFHDYFTSALPEPQKSPQGAVGIPIGTEAPVRIYGTGKPVYIDINGGNRNTWRQNADSGIVNTHRLQWNGTLAEGNVSFSNSTVGEGGVGLRGVADLTNATAATINALRLAFATQRIFEKDARYGTRYNEVIRGHFGVTSPNASLHVPEYLGGSHFFINVETVLQNSSTNAESPLGETGAFSVTFDTNDDFTKSFTEHGCLIGLICVRARHTYQQGVARQWTRTSRLDLYWPSFAHIGNQPIYNSEIYATGTAKDNEVFGYKEAWAEYKYTPSIVSGMLSSLYSKSLDSWHYADKYDSLPTLSQKWIEEPTEFVDRTLLVQSKVTDQFIADIAIEREVSAVMPLHSTPGLIDHF